MCRLCVALLAGLSLSLLDQANAQSESGATWMVTRGEVCLLCHMHTQAASSAFLLIIHPVVWWVGVRGQELEGNSQYGYHAREEAGGPRSPASML